MTSRDFCFWLQGFFELRAAGSGAKTDQLDDEQVRMIERHLALVFKHEIDPSAGGSEHQKKLSEVHNPAAQLDQETLETFKRLMEEAKKQPRPPFKMPHTPLPPSTKIRC